MAEDEQRQPGQQTAAPSASSLPTRLPTRLLTRLPDASIAPGSLNPNTSVGPASEGAEALAWDTKELTRALLREALG